MHEQRSSVHGVSAVTTEPSERRAAWRLVYAPGAGSGIDDPFGNYACRSLAEEGVSSVRFQFPYMEAGSRRPDRASVLEETWLAVLDAAREEGVALVAGGRSMGGRYASVVASKHSPSPAAEGSATMAGLALFAYALHQPGRPDQPRSAHLEQIGVPTLFCSGESRRFRRAGRTPGGGRARAGLAAASDDGRRPRVRRPQEQRPHTLGRVEGGGRRPARVGEGVARCRMRNPCRSTSTGEPCASRTHPRLCSRTRRITKAEILQYYLTVADTLMPHMMGRPVIIHAFPHGTKGRPYHRRWLANQAPRWALEGARRGGRRGRPGESGASRT